MGTIELLRADALALPNLAKFAVAMAIVVGIPPLSRRVGLPAVVGLSLESWLGPHCIVKRRYCKLSQGEQRKVLEMGVKRTGQTTGGDEPSDIRSDTGGWRFSKPFCLSRSRAHARISRIPADKAHQ